MEQEAACLTRPPRLSDSKFGVALRWLSPGAEYRLLRVKDVWHFPGILELLRHRSLREERRGKMRRTLREWEKLWCKFARFMGGISLITWEVRSLWRSNAI